MKKFFKSLPIRNKVFITFASGYVLLITIIAVIIYWTNVKEMSDQAQSMSKLLSAQSSRSIDLYFEDIERLSLAFFTDSYIQETLANENDDVLRRNLSIRNGMFLRLFSHTYPLDHIEGVTIYSNGGVAFDYKISGNINVRSDPNEEEWMTRLSESEKNTILYLPTSEITHVDGTTTEVVSLVREIYSIPFKDKIGSMKIDINIDVFTKLLEIENMDDIEEHMRILILDEASTVIYDHQTELIGKQINLDLELNQEQPTSEGLFGWQENNYLYANNYSPLTKWNSLVLIDNQMIVYERKQIFWFIVISGLIAISIIFVISYFLSYSITKPLTGFVKEMKKVESGDLTDRMKLGGYPEMDVLARVYNSMLNSINKLITEVYESSITEKNAKISALQSQINPHFLYNTLNVMKSIGRVKGAEEVAEISESLSELFKYTMKDLDEPVALQEEINHVDNYMRILSHRFMDRYSFTKQIAENTKHVKVPKLLIQPIVENAVNHGLTDRKDGGIINLDTYVEDNNLVIKVSDNGIGMDTKTLEKVKESINRKKLDVTTAGVALNNISQRLRLLYGPRYQIYMESEENIGTIVRVILPLDKREELR